MYSYFKGKIFEVLEELCIIEVNNIGYNIYMSKSDLALLKEGKEVVIYTYFKHSEDDMRLYGFLEKHKLEFFKKLITVSGVGSKVALSIISNIEVEEMCSAIATENVLLLKKIPGIGPKMAAKIIFELKDKITNDEMIKKVKKVNNDMVDEAIIALKVLGYKEKEFIECIDNMDTEGKSVQDIIKLCLKYIQK